MSAAVIRLLRNEIRRIEERCDFFRQSYSSFEDELRLIKLRDGDGSTKLSKPEVEPDLTRRSHFPVVDGSR